MTRKDYILIAEILQKANDGNWGILGTAKMFADMLHADNPRFDREHFLAVVRGEKELNSRPSRRQ